MKNEGAPQRRVKRWWLVGPLLVLAGLAWRFTQSLDGSLHHYRPSHLLLDRQQRFLGEFAGDHEVYGFWPLPAQLPDRVVVTTLETEDREYFSHPGVNAKSVGRAVLQNVRNQAIISGASTVAMQVSRLQHPQARTLTAKIHEAAEALLLIQTWGHDAVLRQYLTIAPYGNRAHGVVRAARLYFDKPIEDLSWLQAAFLAALPQQPSRMSPFTPDGHARALARARRILTQLHDRAVISDEEFRLALSTDLTLVPQPHRDPDVLHALLAWAPRFDPHEVIHHATIDLDIQHLAAEALRTNLATHASLLAGQTAGLVVDTASGDVLAWVGSNRYGDSENRGAIDYLQVKRSPGSALKPFIYALALEQQRLTAATELPDTPTEFAMPSGGVYVPENITHTFLGPMLARQALANSRNIPALRVLSEVGVGPMTDFFVRAGVSHVSTAPDAYGLTLAIGSLPVTPVELATLYTALANNGTTRPLRSFTDEPKREGTRLLSSHTAQLVRHILADPEARRPGFPPNGPLDFDYAVAIKTGTSQGYRDAWAAAFSDRLLVVTWVGNHDQRRMNMGSGAVIAAPAAHAILDSVMPTYQPYRPISTHFDPPADAVALEVCALSGRLPEPGCTHRRTEYFVRGTEPTERCPFHQNVAIDQRNGLRATPECPKPFVTARPMLALPEAYSVWAQRQHVTIAPTQWSPLCGGHTHDAPSVVIREPRTTSRYLFDPDTPREFSTVRLSARVTPADAPVVWLVDGRPVAEVGYPHEFRWAPTPGTHVIRAALARYGVESRPVRVIVDD